MTVEESCVFDEDGTETATGDTAPAKPRRRKGRGLEEREISLEAIIAAVQTFNGAGLTFRSEIFLVTAVIAWTYLLHAWFRREGIDYRYSGDMTRQGADRYRELGKCRRHPRCPVKGGARKNLEFLLEIRHEIEHRMTNRIDDAIGAKL